MKKLYGFTCDICRKFVEGEPEIFTQGKKRVLHFCSLKCKKKYLTSLYRE